MQTINELKIVMRNNIIHAKNIKRIKQRNIKRVGICVTKHFNNIKKLKDFIFKLKMEFNNSVEIITTGNTLSYEKKVKSYALQFDMTYKEFIPAHMQKTLYSVMPASFFGKEFSPKNFYVRDSQMAKYIDYLVVFFDEKDKGEHNNLINVVEKLQKKVIYII